MKILIADDHEIVRMSIKLILESNNTSLEIFTAGSGRDALKIIISESIELVILDLSLPNLDGFEVMKRCPPSGVLRYFIYSGMNENALTKLTKNYDVVGAISKSKKLNIFSDYITQIINSQKITTSDSNGRDDIWGVSDLSEREVIVLKYLSQGFNNKKIATELFLSEKTISTYKVRLMKKLKLSNSMELYAFCRDNII